MHAIDASRHAHISHIRPILLVLNRVLKFLLVCLGFVSIGAPVEQFLGCSCTTNRLIWLYQWSLQFHFIKNTDIIFDSTLSPNPGESTQAGNARRALSMWSFKLVSINFCRECTFSNFHLSSSHSASAKLVPFPLINGQIDVCLIWRLIGRRKASCGPNIWANIPSKYSPLFSFLQLSKHLERLKRWPDISFPKYTPPAAIPIHQS